MPTGKPPRRLADMTDQARQGIGELTGLVKDMRAGKGTVGKLMTDEQLYAELQPLRRDGGRRDADDQARAGARSAS